MDFLASALEQRGCKVLKSSVNERLKSLRGLETGGEALASEITRYVRQHPSLTRLSVVGNSLGGLYARYAMHVLFNPLDGTMAGLKPHRLLTIATPHLGVRNWTFVEDIFGASPAKLPPGIDLVKRLVARTMLSTGRTVFGFDTAGPGGRSLLYAMATDDKFLLPLRAFTSRRLYANLQKDFVVPLGTAAFLSSEAVAALRSQHLKEEGIVAILRTGDGDSDNDAAGHGLRSGVGDTDGSCAAASDAHAMIASLDSVGWEKVVVNFPRSVLPLAHNKICALSRQPTWLYHRVLGFDEGSYVMLNATSWLTA